MEVFTLTPDEFTDLAEYDEPGVSFNTRAGFTASRERTPPETLTASWASTYEISYRAFALSITLTPTPT